MMKEAMMTVLGYDTGPIECEAAFIADFDVDASIPIEGMVSQMDSDRRTMAARAGMRMKYMPLRFDPATGAHQIGGRYLFDTWENMRDYMHFTSEELEFEPGVKFWDRPFFSNIDRRAMRVVGAYDFMPVSRHYASRVERFDLAGGTTLEDLRSAWLPLRDAASNDGLAGMWLLTDEEGRQVTLLTTVTQLPCEDVADQASLSLARLERGQSLSRHLGERIRPQATMDRSSLNLAIWLPRSEALGGDACIFPTYPTHPLPILIS